MKFNYMHYEYYKDIFGYYKEIQKINKGFRLLFNKFKNKLTIININKNNEICYSFNHISEINLHRLRFLKIENFKNIIDFIDENNINLEYAKRLNQKEILDYSLNEINKLSTRSSKINNKDINKIIGVTKC